MKLFIDSDDLMKKCQTIGSLAGMLMIALTTG